VLPDRACGAIYALVLKVDFVTSQLFSVSLSMRCRCGIFFGIISYEMALRILFWYNFPVRCSPRDICYVTLR